MRKAVLYISFFTFLLAIVFQFSKVSLNGFRSDQLFIVGVFVINLISFVLLKRAGMNKKVRYFNLIVVILIGLWLLLEGLTGGFLPAENVYTQKMTKENLASSLSGKYTKAYFRYRYIANGNGVYWETSVPTWFPVIEVETMSPHPHLKQSFDSNYLKIYKHVPE
jgi:hypothetical protein